MRNHIDVILSRRRRISRFLPLTKARSFGYRLRMTLPHSLSTERMLIQFLSDILLVIAQELNTMAAFAS